MIFFKTNWQNSQFFFPPIDFPVTNCKFYCFFPEMVSQNSCLFFLNVFCDRLTKLIFFHNYLSKFIIYVLPRTISEIRCLFQKSFDGIHHSFPRLFIKVLDFFFTIDWWNSWFFACSVWLNSRYFPWLFD